MSGRKDLLEEKATRLLREADEGTTARERGYSHGELPGPPPKVQEIHLTQEHWQNVGRDDHAEVSEPEKVEERRSAGAYSDERADGETVTIRLPKGIDPRSWLSGWDARAQAEYLVYPSRSNGVWNDQAWRRRRQRAFPPITCPVDGEVFQPLRTTAVYCSSRCSSAAARERRKARQANERVA